MKISTHNDWDPLREIIVGIADGARVPTVDASTMSFSYANSPQAEVKKIEGPLPQWVVDEANEDIEALVVVLETAGVKVHRPIAMNTGAEFSTPEWTSTGWYNWCPRDLLLPLRNLMLEVPSPTRSRYFETRAYRHIMMEAINDGVEWLAAPKPILADDTYTFEDLSRPTLRNLEPAFDAPNIVRLGRDLLYQVSNSGNVLGFQWLNNVLSPRGYRLHMASSIYSFAHFDSTIIPLRPGLVLLNSTRVNPNNCPSLFDKWDKLYFQDVIPPETTRSSPHNNFTPCSPYIALNVLSIDPQTVCLDEKQLPLIRLLESRGMTCVPLPMRHARNLSGGFHCATLDLVREGEIEDYFS